MGELVILPNAENSPGTTEEQRAEEQRAGKEEQRARDQSPDAARAREEDKALVEAFLAGRRGAFDEIFRKNRGVVLSVLGKVVPREGDLEDLVQQSFVEVFRSLSKFEGRSKLSSWIASIAVHVGYRHLRTKRRRIQTTLPDRPILFEVPNPEDSPACPSQRVSAREVADRTRDILLRLPEKKRTVFVLNDLEGIPQEEIAATTNASIATVRSRLFYARKEFWKLAEANPVLVELSSNTATP